MPRDKRTCRVAVYLSPAEYEVLKSRADRENRSQSETAARLIVKELKRLEK